MSEVEVEVDNEGLGGWRKSGAEKRPEGVIQQVEGKLECPSSLRRYKPLEQAMLRERRVHSSAAFLIEFGAFPLSPVPRPAASTSLDAEVKRQPYLCIRWPPC